MPELPSNTLTHLQKLLIYSTVSDAKYFGCTIMSHVECLEIQPDQRECRNIVKTLALGQNSSECSRDTLN